MGKVVECEDRECGILGMTAVDLGPSRLGMPSTLYESSASEDHSAGGKIQGAKVRPSLKSCQHSMLQDVDNIYSARPLYLLYLTAFLE